MILMTIDCCVVFRCVCGMFIIVYEAFLCARNGLRPPSLLLNFFFCFFDVLAELNLWYHSFRMSSTRDVDASSGLNTHSEGIWHSEGAWEASLTRSLLRILAVLVVLWKTMELG